jgi:hypothetical protein
MLTKLEMTSPEIFWQIRILLFHIYFILSEFHLGMSHHWIYDSITELDGGSVLFKLWTLIISQIRTLIKAISHIFYLYLLRKLVLMGRHHWTWLISKVKMMFSQICFNLTRPISFLSLNILQLCRFRFMKSWSSVTKLSLSRGLIHHGLITIVKVMSPHQRNFILSILLILLLSNRIISLLERFALCWNKTLAEATSTQTPMRFSQISSSSCINTNSFKVSRGSLEVGFICGLHLLDSCCS